MNNFSVLLVERIFSLACAMIISMLIARVYGPENSGFIQTAISIMFLFKFVCSFGVQHIISREISRNITNVTLISVGLKVYNFGFLIFILLVSCFLILLQYPSEYFLFLLFLAIGVYFERFIILQAYFVSSENFKDFAICVLTGNAVSLFYVVLCISLGFDLILMAFYMPIQFFVTYILARKYYLSYIGRHSVIGANEQFKYLLKSGYPLALSGAVYTVYMKIDVVMIERIIGLYEAGIYSAASKLIMPLSFFGYIFSQLYFKRLVSEYSVDQKIYLKTVVSIVRKSHIFSLFFLFLLILFGDFILEIVYGTAFKESYSVLVILSFSFLVIFSSAILSRMLVIENLIKYEPIKTSIACILNLTLNFILIPLYGIKGAAIATVVAYLFADLILYYLFYRTRHIFYAYFGLLR